MLDKTFFHEMENRGWTLDSKSVEPNSVHISPRALVRLKKAPDKFIKFITSFTSLANSDETTWFLSYTDFVDNDDVAFPWNEFENQSLDIFADEVDMIREVKSYWNSYIPFVISVKNGYSYIAIGIRGSNWGRIYKGEEPEYEDSICIYENLHDFIEAVLKEDILV